MTTVPAGAWPESWGEGDGHRGSGKGFVEVDRNGLEVLDRQVCLRLLGTASIGRVGITLGALPVILPVNFRLVGECIVFRTGAGTKLDAATADAIVAFEVDDVLSGGRRRHRRRGRLCEHLVVMRRLPVDRRLSSLVRTGASVDGHLWRLAHLVAAFHARSARSDEADEEAGVSATRRRWDANTDALIGMAGRSLFDDTTVGLVHGLACRYLDGRAPLFERRVAEGRAVDGHGDLLADDIFCLDDGPRVLDCIEFDDRLRLGDGLADAAFLAMDLERLGRPDLGRAFLAAYAEHRGDVWPPSLAHHQIAYRAQVRAKVTAIRAEQGDQQAMSEARSLLDLAAAHLEAGRVKLVLVGGLPGTGKSTLASALGRELEAPVLRSDEVRKELGGLDVLQPAPAAFGEGIYTDGATAVAYRALLDRATVALGLGETVVLDASWTSAAARERARAVARRTHTDLIELRCDVPAPVAADRMRRRAATGQDASDATPSIAAAMAARSDPWPEAATVDTGGDPDRSLSAALHHVRRAVRPAGSTG